jgi:hypothetical protein
MPRRPVSRLRKLRRRLRKLWPGVRRRRRWLKRLRNLPVHTQVGAGLVVAACVWAAANLTYQIWRKPTELFFPISETLHKTPAQTWEAYDHLFRRHSTHVITPELLAALAQVEGSGNPVVRTYWRWSWVLHPFEVWRPASSAVGMYQFTDGTFELAKRYCIHDHRVVEEGPWYAWRSCWFNELYFRVVPSHAIELTSAFLDRSVAITLARHGIAHATLAQKQRLAAVIHLCGAGAGDRFVRGGFALGPQLRCGDHGARGYVLRVEGMMRIFEAIS